MLLHRFVLLIAMACLGAGAGSGRSSAAAHPREAGPAAVTRLPVLIPRSRPPAARRLLASRPLAPSDQVGPDGQGGLVSPLGRLASSGTARLHPPVDRHPLRRGSFHIARPAALSTRPPGRTCPMIGGVARIGHLPRPAAPQTASPPGGAIAVAAPMPHRRILGPASIRARTAPSSFPWTPLIDRSAQVSAHADRIADQRRHCLFLVFPTVVPR